MKWFLVLVSVMLMGGIHNMNAQNETDYSLKEIGSTLSKLNLTSSGVCLGDFHDGVARVRAEKGNDIKYGFINKQGKIVTPSVNYDYFGGDTFSEGLAVVSLNGKWGYVDIYGNSTFNPKANPSMTATQSSQVSDNNSAQTINSSFKGGEAAMKKFIYSTVKYPVVAVEKGEQGIVIVGFTVEADGSLSNIHIEKSVSASLDKEAKRVVSNMPKWQPAQSGGVSVKSTQTVEVSFRLQ